MKKILVLIIFYRIISFSEISIILSFFSKTIPSLSDIGSDVSVINNLEIFYSNDNFIADIIDSEIPGAKFSNG